MKNGQIWKDTDGNLIQAHGGCILYHRGRYYWYGENKDGKTDPQKHRIDVIGVSCYSSTDMVNWKNEGVVLPAVTDDPESMLSPDKVLERPKVLYNETTRQFVMWFHADDAKYLSAMTGVAVADTPTGPFRFLGAKRPNVQESRDFTVFSDDDGKAYLLNSSNHNKTMNINCLTGDYTDVDGMFVSVLTDQEREAPAVVKHDGLYYMVSSGCTGWAPNAALYATCPHIMGKWKLIDNPCVGEGARKTYGAQSAYIFTVLGTDYLLLDHWNPQNLRESGYSILPIVYQNGAMTIPWQDEWNGIR